MLSFSLPRFCDQSLDRSRKERFYPGAEPWMAKLDTVVHELYHIDPELAGIRRIEREDGTYSANCHGHALLRAGRRHGPHLSRERTDRRPCTISCATTSIRSTARYGGVVGTSFRTFPSFPQRYIERLPEQPPCDADSDGVTSNRCAQRSSRPRYTEDDLHVRQFTKDSSRRVMRKGQFRAA